MINKKDVKGDDFLKQFKWYKNLKIVSSKLKSILEEDKSIRISNWLFEEEDDDYYISFNIGFKNPNNNTYINIVSYDCYMNKDRYQSRISLYTSNCKNAGRYGRTTLRSFETAKEGKEDFSKVDDIVYFLSDHIIYDINLLKGLLYKECVERECVNE